ncbi:MAG: hypothetical protein K8W52_40380 [Deltaproteobacteria bacterium]|nr:hypothetical protein [Deltaproteobacteria bacterium]
MKPTVLQRVRYAVWLPWLFGACAAINALAAVTTHQPMQGLLTILTGGIGIAYALNPILELTATELRLKNAWGMTVRAVRFRSLGDLELEGRTIWIRTAEGQRTRLTARLVHGADWAAFVDRVASARPPSP